MYDHASPILVLEASLDLYMQTSTLLCGTGPELDCRRRIIAAWCQGADGKRHGPYVEWHESVGNNRPVIAVVGGYEDGMEQGEWTYYYETGAASRREIYADGVLLESRSFELLDGLRL